MAKTLSTLFAFNRGLVSRLALARTDLKRMALSAEIQTNWMPRVLGSMMLRPGLGSLGATYLNSAAVLVPFVFAIDDTAVLELTEFGMRVWVDDLPVTRAGVPTTVTNGSFTTDLSGWTGADEGAAVSVWATGGLMSLTGTGTQSAIRRQLLTITSGVQHSFRIRVTQGRVTVKVGAAIGDDSFLSKTLGAGYHSLVFSPGAVNRYVQLSNVEKATALVDYIEIETAGSMLVPTPWSYAQALNLRYDTSGDVIFCANEFYKPHRIERLGARSWSVVEHLPEDGPFLPGNISTITVAPSALSGTVNLTASRNLFTGGEVGGLFKLGSKGQTVTATITAANQFSDPIRVTSVSTGRDITVTMSGADVGTVTIQRSVGAPGAWSDAASYATPVNVTYNDALDNQIMYYRIGVKTGDYTAGTVTLTLAHAVGSITGIARVKAYVSPTQVTAVVLKDFGSTAATEYWSEGAWSSKNGYPSAVTFFEGRLWWAGGDRYDGSVPDAYDSHDETIEGDSGPISGSVGFGPVDSFAWMTATTNLVLGGEGAEYVIRGSYLDEPLTPTNFGIKAVSNMGSSAVAAAKIDNSVVFVQRNAERVYELAFSGSGENPVPQDFTFLATEACASGVLRMAVQRQPDTRLHCVRRDGKVAIFLFDKVEEITAWILFETDGVVEDVVVLPGYETPFAAADAEHTIQLPDGGWVRAGAVEDAVYYLVKRTVNGVNKRYLEKWGREAAGQGGAFCALVDSFRKFESTIPFTVISATSGTDSLGLTHLEGKTVAVWGGSKDLGTYVVTAGSITLSEPVTLAYVGLVYTAKFKSAKLVVGSSASLTQRKRIDHVGLILADTHARGLKYGVDFDNLDDLPGTEGYAAVDPNAVWTEYDEDSIELNGTWDTDTRLCLQAQSPRPCTVLAAVISVAGHDKQ